MGKHAKLKEIPAAKAAVDKEWEKLEKISAWNLAKVRSKENGDRGSKDGGRYSSFCIISGHLSSENAELEAKHQKYKGRVVFRGDIVKDDSESYAVFIEQGSSFSISNDSTSPDCLVAMDKKQTQYQFIPK